MVCVAHDDRSATTTTPAPLSDRQATGAFYWPQVTPIQRVRRYFAPGSIFKLETTPVAKLLTPTPEDGNNGGMSGTLPATNVNGKAASGRGSKKQQQLAAAAASSALSAGLGLGLLQRDVISLWTTQTGTPFTGDARTFTPVDDLDAYLNLWDQLHMLHAEDPAGHVVGGPLPLYQRDASRQVRLTQHFYADAMTLVAHNTYRVRRTTDGISVLLLVDTYQNLYLIDVATRAFVVQLPMACWSGILNGRMCVLEATLVPTFRGAADAPPSVGGLSFLQQYRVIVDDVLLWNGIPSSSHNLPQRLQELDNGGLEDENNWGYPSPHGIVILKCVYVTVEKAQPLLIPPLHSEHPTSGITFVPCEPRAATPSAVKTTVIAMGSQLLPIFKWTPPESITINFVVGGVKEVPDGPASVPNNNRVFSATLQCEQSPATPTTASSPGGLTSPQIPLLRPYRDEYADYFKGAFPSLHPGTVVSCMLRRELDGAHWWDIVKDYTDNERASAASFAQVEALVHDPILTAEELAGVMTASHFICTECGTVSNMGKVDPNVGKYYCRSCWETYGVGDCVHCNARQQPGSLDGQTNAFYCKDCWASFAASGGAPGTASSSAPGLGAVPPVAVAGPSLKAPVSSGGNSSFGAGTGRNTHHGPPPVVGLAGANSALSQRVASTIAIQSPTKSGDALTSTSTSPATPPQANSTAPKPADAAPTTPGAKPTQPEASEPEHQPEPHVNRSPYLGPMTSTSTKVPLVAKNDSFYAAMTSANPPPVSTASLATDNLERGLRNLLVKAVSEQISSPGHVLHLCCGNGRGMRHWVHLGARAYIGVDVSDSHKEVADGRKESVTAEWEQARRGEEVVMGVDVGGPPSPLERQSSASAAAAGTGGGDTTVPRIDFFVADAFSHEFWSTHLGKMHPKQFNVMDCKNGFDPFLNAVLASGSPPAPGGDDGGLVAHLPATVSAPAMLHRARMILTGAAKFLVPNGMLFGIMLDDTAVSRFLDRGTPHAGREQHHNDLFSLSRVVPTPSIAASGPNGASSGSSSSSASPHVPEATIAPLISNTPKFPVTTFRFTFNKTNRVAEHGLVPWADFVSLARSCGLYVDQNLSLPFPKFFEKFNSKFPDLFKQSGLQPVQTLSGDLKADEVEYLSLFRTFAFRKSASISPNVKPQNGGVSMAGMMGAGMMSGAPGGGSLLPPAAVLHHV